MHTELEKLGIDSFESVYTPPPIDFALINKIRLLGNSATQPNHELRSTIAAGNYALRQKKHA